MRATLAIVFSMLLAPSALRADPAAASAAGAQPPAIRFLSPQEAASELTSGPERDYYARLELAEMRAKTGLALQGMTLEAARELTRAHYAAGTLEFSAQEIIALRSTVMGVDALVRSEAPLYVRTPWAFIKVSSSIEGGLPHTRGDFIVLSDAFLAAETKRHGPQWADTPIELYDLLIHEQTHILQRRNPKLFAALYTDVFGFRRVSAPPPPWLLERNVINPDAPDCDWAFPVGAGVERRWVIPYLVLTTLDRPRMPNDFAAVAMEVTETAGHWEFAQQRPPPALQPLDSLQDYMRAFPDHGEDFHPNEIAAGLLGAMLSGAGRVNPEHELWAKTRAWSVQSLR